MNLAQHILILGVRLYRWVISPAQLFIFGPGCGCRFSPTCSQYAIEAVKARGALTGTWLAVRRVCRCHPWGASGFDPVPRKSETERNLKLRSPRRTLFFNQFPSDADSEFGIRPSFGIRNSEFGFLQQASPENRQA